MSTPDTMRSSSQDNRERRRTLTLIFVVVSSLVAVVFLSRWMDAHRPPVDSRIEEENLYLTGNTLKRMSLGFNGLVADWYWMRSLQYVGNKLINYQGEIQIDNLGALNLHLLYPLLDNATTLDPKFMIAYQYGAVVLPAINEEDAIKLVMKGIEQNPDSWRLYSHLGYIYWKRGDYQKASESYAAGTRINGSPEWMQEMSARLAAEGGSSAIAREIYKRLYEQTDDKNVRELMARRLLQVDSFEERDAIRSALKSYRNRNGRCPTSWKEVLPETRAARLPDGKALRIDTTGEPLDPSNVPYVLSNDGCDVDLSLRSRVPYK